MTSSRRRLPTEILIVSSANACRSPMGEALLRGHLAAAGVPAVARSAGTRVVEATPVEPHVRRVVPGLEKHRSRSVTAHMLISADLVLAIANEQVREVGAIEPAALGWTFTLREFVALAAEHGIRVADEPFDEWVAKVGAGRSEHPLESSASPVSTDDDIGNPIGQMLTVYQQTAATLDDLLLRFVDLAWPPATRRPPEPAGPSGTRWHIPRGRRDSAASRLTSSTRRRFRRS